MRNAAVRRFDGAFSTLTALPRRIRGGHRIAVGDGQPPVEHPLRVSPCKLNGNSSETPRFALPPLLEPRGAASLARCKTIKKEEKKKKSGYDFLFSLTVDPTGRRII